MQTIQLAPQRLFEEKFTRLELIQLYSKVHRLKSAQIRHLIIEEKRDDILFYLLFPKYFFKEFYPQIWKFQDEHPESLVLGPRTFGKTLGSRVRQIGKILRNPNRQILIASKTDGQAASISGSIRSSLENSLISEMFGNQVGTPWKDKGFNVASRTSFAKEKTVMTVGIDGAAAGKSFTDHIWDDLIDEENTRTRSRRESIKQWVYSVLRPTLPEGGRIEALGTRYNPDDFWGHLIANEMSDSHLVIDCFDPFYLPKLVSIFPEKASIPWLLDMRKKLGSLNFNAQYRNSVEAMKGEIFKYEWFNFAKTAPFEDLRKFQGIDLAVTEDDMKKGAAFAEVTIGLDKAPVPNIWVIDSFKRKIGFPKQTRMIAKKHRQWDPIRAGLEGNAYQKAQYQQIKSMPEYQDLRVFPVYTNKDKVTNAWKASAFFESSRVYVLEHLHDFIDDLTQLPKSGIWDTFDAFYIALRVALSRTRKQRSIEPDLVHN